MRTIARRLIALGAATAAGLGLLALGAVPAQASEACMTHEGGWTLYDCDTQIERDPQFYLAAEIAAGSVLHIDTENATEEGFWWAFKAEMTVGRDFEWRYTRYGLACDLPSRQVAWNPNLGMVTCMPDYDWLVAKWPDYMAQRDECRRYYNDDAYEAYAGVDPETMQENGTWGCDRWPARPDSGATDMFPDEVYRCAPWEDQSVDPSTGQDNCIYTRYSWDGGGETVQPAPADYTVTESATSTFTASGIADATATVTRKAYRRTVYRTASRYVDGRLVTATGSAKVYLSRTATATRTATASRTATVTKSYTCNGRTEEEARTCAQQQARTAAVQAAQAKAIIGANAAAYAAARTEATNAAAATALTRAKTAAIPRPVLRKAKRLAYQRALAKLY